MSDSHSTTDRAEILRRAYVEVRKLRARVEELESAPTEPIAIVGMACRFPGGADNPAAFWELLREGRDAITGIPPERWNADAFYDPDPQAVRKMVTRHGGFLDGVDRFDPQFFGITPREAASMDPQQRLLLEIAWEALEDAGLAPTKLQGSRSGVFVGLCAYDYSYLMMREPDLNAYMGSGSAHSVASGRLSYVLGLQGPSIALDTACSSALVALHLACQSLRAGECRVALAGAANLVLIPEPVVMFSKAHMLAPDGRCKTFDASADGYVRSEGCGMVVLKRYREALRDGDRVLALIRGSAINQDGRSSGLTAPNGPAQEAVIREALANSGKSATEIDYIETHGTGTPLGDPIEVQAFGRVYGEGRDPAHPLLAGSVKTNVGHLEAAAGIASLIKTVLAIQHGEVPPSLHLRNPNPRIPWDSLPVRIASDLTAWPDSGHARTAGVSSFGFSGTNAHVIVEQAPEIPEPTNEWVRPLHILSLSARTAPALTQLASRFQDHLSTHPAEAFEDICFTANTGRSHFAHRLTLIAAEAKEALSRLAAFQTGRGEEGIATGNVEDGRRREVTFLFTGQGSQYAGMGRSLFHSQPVFRSAVLRCEELFRPHLACALTDVLFAPADSRIDETAFTQPTVFALQYGLTELWRSWGIIPDAAMGHSVGEYAAACAAGVFSVEDAVTLIAARSRLMQALRERGSMAAVMAPEQQVGAAVRAHGGRVAIAAVNGADHVVISGESQSVSEILRDLTAKGIHTQPLAVSHAFHSPLMEPMLDEFEGVAATLRFAAPTVPLVSNLTGTFVRPGEIEQPGYWRRHIRQTVQFAAGMKTLHANGHGLFLEIGPSATLLGMGRLCLPDGEFLWLPSLRKNRDEWEQMLETAAALYIRGAALDWAGFDQGYARRKRGLPTYPFQRERFWVTGGGPAEIVPQLQPGHPLLGRRVQSPLSQIQFEAVLGAHHPPMMQDHKVRGAVVFPGAAYMESALCAASEVLPATAVCISDVSFRQMLALREDCPTRLQLILESEPGRAAIPFRFLSQTNDEVEWTCHASGALSPVDAPAPERVAIGDLQSRCGEEIDVASYYASLRARGLEYGSRFQCLRRLWRGEREALARIDCAPDVYQLHPALLDSAFQAIGALLCPDEEDLTIYIPIALDTLRFYQRAGEQVWCHVHLRPADGSDSEIVSADLQLLDDEGELLAQIEGLHLKRTGATAFERPGDCFYEVEWLALDREASPAAMAKGAWLILPDSTPLPQELARELSSRGESCRVGEFEETAKLRGVIYFAPPHEEQTCAGLLTLVQQLAAHANATPPPLYIVTRGADAILGPPVLDHAPIAGMARVIALEHPELRTLRIDLDAPGPP